MLRGTSGAMTPACRSRNNRIAWAIASVVALLYFISSLTVVVGSYVWLGIFPDSWYAIQNVLYWPFQPYVDFTLSVMEGPEVPYQVYALISRSPFLLVPVLVWITAVRRVRS